MIKYALVVSFLLMSTGCAGTSVVNDSPSPAPDKRCLAANPKDVHLWINAMPGPGAATRPPLHASFTATMPTPGYQLALKVNRVMESFPEQVVLDLIVTRPAGIVAQVVTDTKVNIQLKNFPGSEGSSVQVNCEGAPFFNVEKLMAAH